MGLMDCARKNCESIRCRTYVYGIGYVCRECQVEFKEHLNREGKTNLTEGEIMSELEKFIGTYKPSGESNNRMSVDNFFKQHSNNT